MKKIVITGPESSGKTFLSKQLAREFSAPVVPEFAVEYLMNTGGKYDYDDLLNISIGQIELEDKIQVEYNSNLLICDTDLITIKIWSQVKYDKVDNQILDFIKNREYTYYLLCKPDIPWEYSEFRENPNDRDDLFLLYENELNLYEKSYSVISGSYDNRVAFAKNVVRSILNQ